MRPLSGSLGKRTYSTIYKTGSPRPSRRPMCRGLIRGAGGDSAGVERSEVPVGAGHARPLLERQEHHHAAAAEDQVRGGLLGGLGLARFHAAIDHGPTVVVRGAKAEFAERCVLLDEGE